MLAWQGALFGTDRVTSIASSFIETPTDTDVLLLKNRCEDNDVDFVHM